MPELPEVETVRRTLAPRVIGRRIIRVVIREPRLRQRIAPSFARRLTGRQIIGLERTGKYLVFHLDGGATWLVHLGMTGSLAVLSSPPEPHTHVDITLSDGAVITYNDPRRFGLMKIAFGRYPRELLELGRDPLSEEFTPEYLRGLCRDRKRPIKNLLMDQRFVAGIGNIYATEILFRAGVRPSRASGRLRRREMAAICEATRAVLTEAIALGGSSISDYRDGEGRPGYFQLHLDAYGREGEPCPRCAGAIRSRVLSGRSSFYCARCQR